MKAINEKNLETGDQRVCLYFAPRTGRPLNVSSAQSVCFPHVPTVSKGKKKKENGILRSTAHKALLVKQPLCLVPDIYLSWSNGRLE